MAALITALTATLQATADPRGPLVLAAASLDESMNAAADAWARQGHPRPTVLLAASSALARQVEAGAPADLFASADEDWMDELDRRGLLAPGTRADFVGNRLVVIAAKESTIRLGRLRGAALAAVLARGSLAMADPASVPAGRYGKAALEHLGTWHAVAARVVSGDSVRAALALVERGAAPLGIVYETDALASQAVRIVGVFPPSSHPPIRYPVARLKAATSPDAEDFRRFVLDPAGRAIFRRYGFTRP